MSEEVSLGPLPLSCNKMESPRKLQEAACPEHGHHCANTHRPGTRTSRFPCEKENPLISVPYSQVQTHTFPKPSCAQPWSREEPSKARDGPAHKKRAECGPFSHQPTLSLGLQTPPLLCTCRQGSSQKPSPGSQGGHVRARIQTEAHRS